MIHKLCCFMCFGLLLFVLGCQDDLKLDKFDSGLAIANTNVTGTSEVWLEAECTNISGSGWEEITDTQASNSTYLRVKDGFNSASAPSNTDAKLVYTFNLTSAGSYYFYALAKGPSSGSDSFWFRFNGGMWKSTYDLQNPSFTWKKIRNESYGLVAGENTLEISYREDGLLLDKIFVTQSSTAPTGLGGSASNCNTVPMGDNAWLEAECSTGNSDWQEESNGSASGGKYLTSLVSKSSTPTSSSNKLTYTFGLNSAGSYYLYALVEAASSGSDSFWFRFNGGAWKSTYSLEGTPFFWKKIRNESYGLAAGENTLEIVSRESGLKFDKLYITKSSSSPTGLGEKAINCGGSEDPIPTNWLATYDFSSLPIGEMYSNNDFLYENELSKWGLGSMKVVSEATASDNKAMKMTIDRNDRTTNKNAWPRSELIFKEAMVTKNNLGNYFWARGNAFAIRDKLTVYQYKIKIGENWKVDPNTNKDDNCCSIFEFKQDLYSDPYGDFNLDATFRVRVHGNKYNMILKSNANKPVLIKGVWNYTKTNTITQVGDVNSDKGKWVIWTVVAKWSVNDGLLDVYKDGELVFHKTGNTMYDTNVGTKPYHGPYTKFGIYDACYKADYPESSVGVYREIYFDYVRFGIPE